MSISFYPLPLRVEDPVRGERERVRGFIMDLEVFPLTYGL
jgi:hypothetical protein